MLLLAFVLEKSVLIPGFVNLNSVCENWKCIRPTRCILVIRLFSKFVLAFVIFFCFQ